MAAGGGVSHPLEQAEPLLEAQITRRFLNIAQFWAGYTLPVLLDEIQYHHWEGIAVHCDKAVDDTKKKTRSNKAVRARRR